MAAIEFEGKGEIALLWIDNPPVNALSHAVREGVYEAALQLEQDAAVKAVVLICRGRTFIAGADIREFGIAPKEPHLPDLINRIEASDKPWIAALHGTALGGGFEIALGCHYRVALASAKIGLPEVHLGLLPGAGGTIRLPRLADIDMALEMITGGKPIGAEKALAAGIFDRLAPEDLPEKLADFAVEFAGSIVNHERPLALSIRPPKATPDEAWWEAKLAEIARKARGQHAPLEAAKAVRDGLALPFTEALAGERERFVSLKEGAQSRALRHVFFAERETAKIDEIEGVEPKRLAKIGIVGGGTMGAGIAAAALLAGYGAAMLERDEEAAETGKKRVLDILAASEKRGVISAEDRQKRLAGFSAGADYAALADADLAIEAVFEDMEAKKAVFAKLAAAMPADAILATNTSYLDVDEIAASIEAPERVLGLHFFSPAHIMKLVEVIKGEKTAPETLATGFALAKRLRKTPVLAGVCDGFIGNRILMAYRRECDFMLEDGALPHEIDAAMRAFGMPMGPFEMADMAGLDIGWATRKRQAANRDPSERYVKIADRICELGRFGQKTGAGWYRYENDPRKGERDPLVEEIILEESAAKGIERRGFTEAEIQSRVVTAMASEGEKILAEGIARRASDIDIVMILGYGFPRWRGGPMYMADNGEIERIKAA